MDKRTADVIARLLRGEEITDEEAQQIGLFEPPTRTVAENVAAWEAEKDLPHYPEDIDLR